MRPRSLAAILLCLTGALHAQTLGPVDWIFLVDTSKSMRGIGGTKDIWLDVKVSLDSFVRETGERDTVALYAFDGDVREIEATSRGDLYRAILSLPAEGNRTHLGAAIAEGLGRAELLRRAGTDATRRQVVVLFTDGKEDVKGIRNPVPIAANLDRVGKTFIFFVSMGDHEPQLDAFDAATEQATVLKAPTADRIRNIARDIRAKIPPPPSPPPEPIVVQPPVPPPVEESSPVMKAVIAAALIAVIAAIILIALHQQRSKNRLEGELEILRPHTAPDAAFVGLPNLRANEVVLSSVLPQDALGGSDARLFVRRNAGRKKVWIAAQSGSLRVNDVETPMSALYDADTIDIGGARLRFNRVGDERPLESNQEADL